PAVARLRQLRSVSRFRGPGRGAPRRRPGTGRTAGARRMTHNSYSHPFSRNGQSMVARWFWTVDRGLLGAALTLIALGVALSFASSLAAIGADESITDPCHYRCRMMFFSTMGLFVILGALLLSPPCV